MAFAEYYDSSGTPSTGGQGSSSAMRAEFDLIQTGFGKLPDITGNGGKAVVINAGGTAMTVTSGTLLLAGNFETAGASGITLTSTGLTNVTLPTTGTIVTLAGAETLTNKTLTSPVVGGTITGTYTLGGTPTFPSSLVTLTGSQTLTNKTLTAPTMTAPVLGVATATSLNGLTITTSSGTLTVPNGVVLTGPASSGTAATLAGIETLTNKTLTAPVFGGTITGTIGITPASAGTMDNVAIGGATPRAGTFTTLSATVTAYAVLCGSTSGTGALQAVASVGTSGQVLTSGGAGTLPSFSGVSTSPTGAVMDFAGSSAPSGWLECDGSAVSRATYAALFTAISTTWGVGDGATTFNVPDMRGRVAVGSGTGAQSASGVNADVDTTSDTLTVTSNSATWITGMAVTFTLASGTITGLTSGTTYYIVRSSATLIKLASFLYNAQNGVVIDLTAKSSPVWTIAHALTARTLGVNGGEESHAMSITELVLHSHSQTGNLVDGAAGASEGGTVNLTTTGSTGGYAAMNNMQPFSVFMKIIKT